MVTVERIVPYSKQWVNDCSAEWLVRGFPELGISLDTRQPDGRIGYIVTDENGTIVFTMILAMVSPTGEATSVTFAADAEIVTQSVIASLAGQFADSCIEREIK